MIGRYRLPTDGEWEYACRAGTTTWFNNGSKEHDAKGFAWLNKPAPAPVGTLVSNAFGLFDMHANVWEICQDYFALDDFKGLGPQVTDPTGPATGSSRVMRGGGFDAAAAFSRSSARAAFDGPRNNVGFRPAVSVDFVRAAVGRAGQK